MSLRKSFLLRIEPGLYKELESWAQQELRSVNGQIEYLLAQAVARRKRGGPRDEPPQVRPVSDVTGQLPSGLATPEGDG